VPVMSGDSQDLSEPLAIVVKCPAISITEGPTLRLQAKLAKGVRPKVGMEAFVWASGGLRPKGLTKRGFVRAVELGAGRQAIAPAVSATASQRPASDFA
jgi:hypothetical protein